ncbi:hypothetical protein HDU99_002291 [Rhizoclosmatium hyalinum]|nr:hypothetical protein HDU99_002291 [Rhizoclosmatium hyalinum]
MSQTLDLIPHSNLTASTFDNEVDSPCYDRCHPNQVAVPGSKVYWQSVADAKCQNQWMEADWSAFGAFTIGNITIDYGALAHTFEGITA